MDAVGDGCLDRLDHSVEFNVVDNHDVPDAAGVGGIDGDLAGSGWNSCGPGWPRRMKKPRQSGLLRYGDGIAGYSGLPPNFQVNSRKKLRPWVSNQEMS